MIDIRGRIWGVRLGHACRFSVDCKMFGAYCYISEIKNAIPLLHGPLGCAFFPKLAPSDAIRTKLLGIKEPPPFPCTDMDEKDVIYGGAEKLRKAIIQVDRYYRPDLIGVIISCPAAIIGDDIADVVNSVKKKIDADIIYTPSSAGFSDDERTENFNRHARDLIRLWKDPDKKPSLGIEKCGRLDALFSLIEQLVEEQDEKIERSVNIDTYGRFHWFERLDQEIDEIRQILKEIGIHVNTVFPGCSVEEIKKIPKAKLNFMRRSERAAKLLKERFGMDYVFDIYGTKYTGIEGVKRFYLDIAERFSLRKKAEEVLKEKENLLEKRLSSIRKEINGKRIAFVCTPLYTTPNFLKLFEKLGLNISILVVNTWWWRRWGMSPSNAKKVADEFIKNLRSLNSEFDVYVDLPIQDEVERIKEKDVDLAIGDILISDVSRTMLYEQNGIRHISPYYIGYSSFRISLFQILRLAEAIRDKLSQRIDKKDLIYLRYNYHPDRFPTLMSDLRDEIRWERIMKKVWRR